MHATHLQLGSTMAPAEVDVFRATVAQKVLVGSYCASFPSIRGFPIAGWFISWKNQEKNDDLEVPP